MDAQQFIKFMEFQHKILQKFLFKKNAANASVLNVALLLNFNLAMESFWKYMARFNNYKNYNKNYCEQSLLNMIAAKYYIMITAQKLLKDKTYEEIIKLLETRKL